MVEKAKPNLSKFLILLILLVFVTIPACIPTKDFLKEKCFDFHGYCACGVYQDNHLILFVYDNSKDWWINDYDFNEYRITRYLRDGLSIEYGYFRAVGFDPEYGLEVWTVFAGGEELDGYSFYQAVKPCFKILNEQGQGIMKTMKQKAIELGLIYSI